MWFVGVCGDVLVDGLYVVVGLVDVYLVEVYVVFV